MLPERFSARPPRPGDLAEVHAVVAAAEMADLGETFITREDIAAEWAQPSFDLTRDAVVIEEGARIVAEGETFHTRGDATIHPSLRGLGLGTWLLGWIEDRGRAKGETHARQTILDGVRPAATLLQNSGYSVDHVGWILEKALPERPDVFASPPGIRLRSFVPGQDDRDVHQVIKDAFSEWGEATSFEDWAASIILRSDFDPELLDVAEEDGAIVGACVGLDEGGEDGWIHQVGVVSSHRRRGIARALLQRSFRTWWERGKRSCALSTDSRTSALSFYERIGMTVKTTSTTYIKQL
jgi:GNAT superfamily N-acetyltransferase